MEKAKLKTVLVILILALLLLIFITLRYQGFIIKDNNQEISIGFIGPLSGYGAAWGSEQQNAMNIAVDEINKVGGINGKNLNVIYEDGKCDGKEATISAQKLINIDNVKILMPDCSAEALAVAPIAEKNKVLVVAVWPTNPSLSESGDYIFRNSYSDEDIAKSMAEELSEYNKVGIITELADYPVGLRDSFKEHFNNRIIEEDVLPNSKDVRSQVIKIISQKPDAIIINPNSVSTGLEILKQLKELNYNGDLYGNFFGGSNEVQLSPYAQEMIFFGDPSVADNSIADHLFSEYKKKYNKEPDFKFAVAAQYDAVYILKQAIESVGENPTDLKNYLYEMDSFTGALGTYHYNSYGDIVGLEPAIKQIKNGEAILIS